MYIYRAYVYIFSPLSSNIFEGTPLNQSSPHVYGFSAKSVTIMPVVLVRVMIISSSVTSSSGSANRLA